MIKHIVAMIMMFVIANSQSLSKTEIKNVLKQTGISENEANFLYCSTSSLFFTVIAEIIFLLYFFLIDLTFSGLESYI